VPGPDVEHWGSAARPSGGKTAVPYFTGGAALKSREGLREDVVYQFIFSCAAILITIFTYLFSKPYL